MFSRDVRAAILVSLNKGMAACWCPQIILRELRSIFMPTFLLSWLKNMLIDHEIENTL